MRRVDAIAARCDFLSVGTNDLTASLLGGDRFGGGRLDGHDPRVLEAIRDVVRTAHAAALRVEVWGELASDPTPLPILVGVGVDELSVGAARVGAVRAWVRHLDASEARELAGWSLRALNPREVERLARPLAHRLELAELGDAGGESVNGAGSVPALRPQP